MWFNLKLLINHMMILGNHSQVLNRKKIIKCCYSTKSSVQVTQIKNMERQILNKVKDQESLQILKLQFKDHKFAKPCQMEEKGFSNTQSKNIT